MLIAFGYGLGKARKRLDTYTTMVETEAEFVQMGLVILVAANDMEKSKFT